MPSSCDRGGIKADPVARDPTRPQQPAPPQRGGSCQRPNPSPHPSSEIKKETPAPAAAIPERGGLRRPGPRAREGALVTPPKTRVVPASWGPARRRHLVPSSCDRGGIKADPVARDPTRPQQPAPPQRGGSCQRPNPSPHPSSEIKKKPAPAAAIPERGGLRRPGPRARERCAIKVNAAQSGAD